MTDLIDRDAAIGGVTRAFIGVSNIIVAEARAIQYIKHIPSAKRTGRWIPKMIHIAGKDWPSGMRCSECKNDALNAEGDEFLTAYCPYCGARMEESTYEHNEEEYDGRND